MLTLIVCNQDVSPKAVASAASPLAAVQHTELLSGHSFFDSATGDLWEYSLGHNGLTSRAGTVDVDVKQPYWTYLGRVTKLGEPLANAPQRSMQSR